jgi:thiamine pyrophosphokinase
MADKTVVVVVSGAAPLSDVALTAIPRGAPIVGADAGVDHARAAGLAVTLAVGDFDSAVSPGDVPVERHPREKDATDLELALDRAVARGATRVTVVGGHGGRLDHFIANALLLASPRFADVEIDAWVGHAHVTVVRRSTELRGRVGSLCTLLAIGGDARGVTTNGLRYPLNDDELRAGSSRGVSNELTEERAAVTVTTGTLLAIQPDALEHDSKED